MGEIREPLRRTDGVPLLHDFPRFRRDPLGFWLDCGRYAPVTRVRLGPRLEYWVVTDPGLIGHILQTRPRDYPRERRLMRLNRMEGPELLFNTDNWQEWLWRRRLMQPAFHRLQVAGFATTIVDETTHLLYEWRDRRKIDLEHAMKTLTMRIIGRTMFSVDVGAATDELQHSYEVAARAVYKRASSPLPLPLWIPTRTNREAKAAVRRRIELLQAIVDARFASEKPRGDLLDMLIAAHLEEDDRRFSAQQLVYEMSGIVFAGHETTALTLMWLFYELSQHADVAARLQEEVDTVLDGRRAGVDDLPQMPYTKWTILEALRLYPPVYVTLREADVDDRYDSMQIPRGTRMLINIRGIQRSDRYWESPEEFRPQRFGPGQAKSRPKFTYIPFLEGPRKCLGDSLAMLEMQLVVPTVLQRFRLQFVGRRRPAQEPGFVLGVRDRMPMNLLPRES